MFGLIVAFALVAVSSAAVGVTTEDGSRWARSEQAARAGAALTEKRAVFLGAYRLLEEERKPEQALSLWSQALQGYPELEDYSLYFLGRALKKLGRREEAVDRFERLVRRHPDSVWVPRAALEAARILLASKSWDRALRFAAISRANAGSEESIPARDSRLAAEATLLLARANQGGASGTRAYSLYQEVRRRWPATAAARRAQAAVRRLRSEDPGRFALQTERDFLGEALLQLDAGDGAGVSETLAAYETRFPAGRLRARMLMLAARAYKREKQTARAAELLREVRSKHAEDPEAAQALHELAVILWNEDRDEEALALFQALVRGGDAGQAVVAESLYATGRIHEKLGKEAQARAAYGALAARFPLMSIAAEAGWRLGWLSYRAGDLAEAQRLFAAAARRGGGKMAGQAALYWQGRAAGRRGRTEEAARLYRSLLSKEPKGYYALWAERRLGAKPSRLVAEGGNTRAAPGPRRLDTGARGHFSRSRELKALGLPALARRELDALWRASAAASRRAFLPWLLNEYTSVHGYAAAFHLARLRAASETALAYLYPRAYWDTLSELAAGKGVDPYLALAVIRQESLFEPQALSPAGAVGLMQLMPSTADRLAPPSPRPLTDPRTNLDLGLTYLRQLLDRYANLAVALAAYNAGEAAAQKWLVRYGELDTDEFIESLSFRETRDYVKHVLANYRCYLALYAEAAPMALAWEPAGAGP